MRSIHERIGWFNCANLNCRRELGQDPVILITTAHMRRFCSVECITDGQAAWTQHTYDTADLTMDESYEAIPQGASACSHCYAKTSHPNVGACPACTALEKMGGDPGTTSGLRAVPEPGSRPFDPTLPGRIRHDPDAAVWLGQTPATPSRGVMLDGEQIWDKEER